MNVFVYGTLKGGMAGRMGELIGPAIVRSLTLYDLGAFPAAVPRAGHVVEGEVWKINGQMLAQLDRIEGHPYFYRREIVDAELLVGDRIVEAWCYVFQPKLDHRHAHVGARWESDYRFR